MKVLCVCPAAVASNSVARGPMAVAIFRELAGEGSPHGARAVGSAPAAVIDGFLSVSRMRGDACIVRQKG